VLATSAGERIVDSRPSDAIPLALQTTNAVFVATEIVAEVDAAAKMRPPTEDLSVGAAEIVAYIVAQAYGTPGAGSWPTELKLPSGPTELKLV
jgi:hypothetical protein